MLRESGGIGRILGGVVVLLAGLILFTLLSLVAVRWGEQWFHLGRPILVMLLISAVTGIAALTRPALPRADLTVWTFAESHARAFRGDGKDPHADTPVSRFEKRTGKTVSVQLMGGRAEDVRLLALFSSPKDSHLLPDLAEIEIGGVGKYFRPPVEEVGFLPLNDYIKKSGWHDRIVQARLAPWSKDGVIFGVPHDLHPVSITYRKDLFDEAGVDLAAATDWIDFREKCRQFQRYWKSRGTPRVAIGLSTSAADQLVLMLMQQRVNLLDTDYTIHLADERVAQTLEFYLTLVAGEEPVGAPNNPASGQTEKDLAEGTVCALMSPDWQVGYIKIYGSGARGKVRMMPLPRFTPTDAPTASWGGTMIGIPRANKHPDLAWQLIEQLYLDHQAVIERRNITNILPPIMDYWLDPAYNDPDEFFGGQKVNQLYISLAREMPPRYVTPFTGVATAQLSDVLNRAFARAQAGKTAGLDRDIRLWLREAADDLQARIEFGTFKP